MMYGAIIGFGLALFLFGMIAGLALAGMLHVSRDEWDDLAKRDGRRLRYRRH